MKSESAKTIAKKKKSAFYHKHIQFRRMRHKKKIHIKQKTQQEEDEDDTSLSTENHKTKIKKKVKNENSILSNITQLAEIGDKTDKRGSSIGRPHRHRKQGNSDRRSARRNAREERVGASREAVGRNAREEWNGMEHRRPPRALMPRPSYPAAVTALTMGYPLNLPSFLWIMTTAYYRFPWAKPRGGR